MNIQKIIHIINGYCTKNYPDDVLDIQGVAIDSRNVKKGFLFFCIEGKHSDGHDYIEDVIQKGAILVIGTKEKECAVPYIKVENVVQALCALAQYKRQQFQAPVIAITGSSGKTTTKEILWHVLQSQGAVCKNFLNYNNQIGMALTILNADLTAIAWVLELGISEAHDMEELGAVALPNLIYITNIANAHTQGLSEKGVAYHKASLVQYLSKEPTQFLNNVVSPTVFIPEQYPTLLQEVKQYTEDYTLIQQSDTLTIHYEGVDSDSLEGKYTIIYNDVVYTISIPYIGHFMQDTLCAIITIALWLQIPFSDIISAFTSLPSIEQRNSVRKYQEYYIIDDSYNANPLSMRAMIATIYSYPTYHYILILGDMEELGSIAEEEHRALGAYIASTQPEASLSLFWKGKYSHVVQKGLQSHGYRGGFYTELSKDVLQKILFQESSAVVLCKGSRSLSLEQEVHILYDLLGEKEL